MNDFNSCFAETHLRKTIATSKIKHLIALVSGFQPGANGTKNSISEVEDVLDPPLERYRVLKFVQVFKLSKVAGLEFETLLKMS